MKTNSTYKVDTKVQLNSIKKKIASQMPESRLYIVIKIAIVVNENIATPKYIFDI